MKVIVANLEDVNFDFRTDVRSMSYRSDHTFSMQCPGGDDWGRYIEHAPSPPPILVREHEGMFVLFTSLRSAEDFSVWLVKAEAQAQIGWNSMR